MPFHSTRSSALAVIVAAAVLVLCLGHASARVPAAAVDGVPSGRHLVSSVVVADSNNCNMKCKESWDVLKGITIIKRDDKGRGNKGEDKRNQPEDRDKARSKFCAGNSCANCKTAQEYAEICGEPAAPSTWQVARC
jgi:hypothetical protein